MWQKQLNILIFLVIVLLNHTVFAEGQHAILLQVSEKNLTVDGKNSRVFDVRQANGKFGIEGIKGQDFDVTVENKTKVPLVLHWHGITDPNNQDGVPYVTQLPIQPGQKYHYQFKLKQAGTFWLHSHYKLQEQKLMAAPLIIYDPEEKKQNEAIMFIQDFTFENPKIIYEKLRHQLQEGQQASKPSAMNMSNEQKPNASMSMQHMDHMSMSNMPLDVSDVKFDAYLVNHRTLNHPDIVRVVAGETLRLRIINASASSNYTIDLGNLPGKLIAVDGAKIKPMLASRFEISIGNRLDIEVSIPSGKKAYPIFALPEGNFERTGMVLLANGADLPHYSSRTSLKNPIMNNAQEKKLTALSPLPQKKIDRSLLYNLEGDMKSYRWTINNQEWPMIKPYEIKPGERIELVFNNASDMSHPMHLHGHAFQITEINGEKINGRLGDTVNVLAHNNAKVILESNNPGIWMLHCHILYHQEGGMMTTLNYEGYPDRFTTEEREQGEKLYDDSLS